MMSDKLNLARRVMAANLNRCGVPVTVRVAAVQGVPHG